MRTLAALAAAKDASFNFTVSNVFMVLGGIIFAFVVAPKLGRRHARAWLFVTILGVGLVGMGLMSIAGPVLSTIRF